MQAMYAKPTTLAMLVALVNLATPTKPTTLIQPHAL
jgi:hypothetical protein